MPITLDTTSEKIASVLKVLIDKSISVDSIKKIQIFYEYLGNESDGVIKPNILIEFKEEK